MNTNTQPTDTAAATGQIDNTSPASVAASAGGMEAGQHGGAPGAPVTAEARTWQTGEPPKDRPIVAIGQVCVQDKHCAGLDPFVGLIRWHRDDSFLPARGYWLYDDCGLSVASDVDARVVIFHWIDQPEGRRR